jgi:hypothetical protein
MDYKEIFQQRYEELAFELFGCENYWDMTPEQEKLCGEKAMRATSDYLADRADELKDQAKYRGMR